MLATILICVISISTFCLCARWLITLATAPAARWSLDGGMSVRARRVARNYVCVSLVLLMGLALIGAVGSFIELFSYQI